MAGQPCPHISSDPEDVPAFRALQAALELRTLAGSSVRPQGGQGPERREMAIGPVQLLVLGFEHPDFHGEIIAELERLRSSETVRVIDALAVHKDADGEIEVVHLSNLSKDEAFADKLANQLRVEDPSLVSPPSQ